MGSEADGMRDPVAEGDLLNVFALVIYIPDPLGKFLDELRRELVPDDNPRAHVSVLPPRPLAVPDNWAAARDEIRALADLWAPFQVEATAIQIFPMTDVIYIEIGAGHSELRQMHAAMASRMLAHQEPYPYHPHITLAQEVPGEKLQEIREIAQARWSRFDGERCFLADRATLVRNSVRNRWVDLAEFSLGAVPAARR
jgi:2'-5' RNA ligase